MSAKTEAETALEFAQSAVSLTPVIILGSGASAAHDIPGMSPLAEHLVSVPIPTEWEVPEQAEWASFLQQIQNGVDLEAALQAVRPTDRQTRFVAQITREFLLPADLKVLSRLLDNRRSLPLTRLYQYLFNSTHTILHVVTPNYDRIAEYAADAADVSTFTGFGYGYLQTRTRSVDTKVVVDGRTQRTVAVWKVHGSLDWFQDSSGQSIGIRSGCAIPSTCTPLMVTPGIDKYRLTYGEPFRTVLGCADAALRDARAYLCIGYGFNDEHLQTKLVERCDRDSIPLLVVTKELTPSAKAFLSGGRCRKYMAIEESGSGSRVYTNSNPTGFEVPESIWRLDKFLDYVIGDAV